MGFVAQLLCLSPLNRESKCKMLAGESVSRSSNVFGSTWDDRVTSAHQRHPRLKEHIDFLSHPPPPVSCWRSCQCDEVNWVFRLCSFWSVDNLRARFTLCPAPAGRQDSRAAEIKTCGSSHGSVPPRQNQNNNSASAAFPLSILILFQGNKNLTLPQTTIFNSPPPHLNMHMPPTTAAHLQHSLWKHR